MTETDDAEQGWQSLADPGRPDMSPQRWFLIAIGVIAVFWLGSLVLGGDEGGSSSSYTVLYHVKGSADYGDITYATPTGTGQQSDVNIPLRRKTGERGIQFTMSKGDHVYISVQNGEESGSVTCIIEVDGIAVAENTSSGAYAIATCNGRL